MCWLNILLLLAQALRTLHTSEFRFGVSNLQQIYDFVGIRRKRGMRPRRRGGPLLRVMFVYSHVIDLVRVRACDTIASHNRTSHSDVSLEGMLRVDSEAGGIHVA